MSRSGYLTEAELCEDFAKVCRARGCTVYPETCGWDLLVVLPDGAQIGVEAKLKGNLHVLSQCARCLPKQNKWTQNNHGPDFIAALVPAFEAVEGFNEIADRLGIWVYAFSLTGHIDEQYPRPHIDPFTFPHGREKLPEFVPDVPAGVPSPIQLTNWKIAAIRLCALLRRRGWVTTKDMNALKLAPSRWISTQHGWLVKTGEREGRHYRYKAKPGKPLPDEDHPEIAKKIATEQQIEANEKRAEVTK